MSVYAYAPWSFEKKVPMLPIEFITNRDRKVVGLLFGWEFTGMISLFWS